MVSTMPPTWSSRQHQYLPDEEKDAFSMVDGDTLFAHSFNKDRADTNAAYVKSFPKVVVSRAHIDGKGHTVGDHKDLGTAWPRRLPPRST
jgi:hypothetical protein